MLDQKKIEKMAFWLLKDLNKAVYQYNMIQSGDRVAVGVSGGKDSLSLLKLLQIRKRSVPEDYEIFAIHISGDTNGPISPPDPALVDWLENSGIKFAVSPLEITAEDTLPINCQRCTWNRKRQIFQIAEQNNCNVVAFGHHADDFAQTTLMNLLFHARLESISPVSQYFDGKFRLIRPMVFIPESKLKNFAGACQFPAQSSHCPQEPVTQRNIAREFINQLNRDFPNVRQNLINAGLNTLLNDKDDQT